MPQHSLFAWINRSCLLACYGLVLVLGLASNLSAQTVSIDQTSRGKYLNFSNWGRIDTGGLNAEIMIETGHALMGHHRIHFRIRPSKLGRFSESGELVLKLSNYGYNTGGTSGHTVTIPIRAGELEAYESALICFDNSSHQVRLQATLNGRSLPGLNTYIYSDQRQWFGQGGGQAAHLTLISESTSRLSGPRRNAFQSLEKLNSQTKAGNWYYAEQFVSQAEMGFGRVDRLPKNWLELSHFSTIQIDGKDFLALKEDANQVLMRYVRAGGYLAIQRVDQPARVWSKLKNGGTPRYTSVRSAADLRKATSLRDNFLQNTAKFRANDFVFDNGDLLPDTPWDDFIQILLDEEIAMNMGVYRKNSVIRSSLGTGMGAPLSLSFEDWGNDAFKDVFLGLLDQQSNFVNVWSEQLTQWHRLSFDSMDALQGDMPAEGVESAPTKDYVADIGLGKVNVSYDRTLRDLLSEDEGTSNASARFANGFGAGYWEWLIPTVGKTPVWSFLLFVVVFVGLVAPALIGWSSRTGRRVWLILWMPFLAFCATSTLFAFGIAKDGFTSVSRIRSLTMVDRNGNGMVWSRQTYFTAYLPREGIRMNDQTMVTRVWPSSDRRSHQQWTREEDGKIVFSGLLPARIQSQYMITHPVSDLQIIEKKPRSKEAAVSAIINRSQSKWKIGIFVDHQGDFYIAENVEPEQEATLTLIDPEDAARKLQEAYAANPLVAPADAPLENQRTLSDSFWGRSYYNTIAPQEANVEEIVWQSMMGKRSTMQSPRGSFFLFVENAPHLEKCLPDAAEITSLHAISGYW